MTDPNDIRKYFTTPPRKESSQQLSAASTPAQSSAASDHQTPLQHSWRANRRIVESDSDTAGHEEPLNQYAGAADDNHTPASGSANVTSAQPVDEAAAIVVVDSDDDDDMWIRPPASRTAPAQEQSAPALSAAALGRTRQRRVTPAQPTRTTRRRFEAEAEVSSTDSSSDDSDNWRCIESDTDAEDLYRSAVAGVRNARASRQQLRRSTITCPVCAKFASFLQHFM